MARQSRKSKHRGRQSRPLSSAASGGGARGAAKEGRQTFLVEGWVACGIAVLAAMHLASVEHAFRATAGLHRWMITYAEGFHRRGLVGTIFQFFAGELPRQEQIALASLVSSLGLWLCLAAGCALFAYAAVRVGDRVLTRIALAFAAFAFINPKWTTLASDNGYLDWLAALAVTAALAAFGFRRVWWSGCAAAVGIVAYWGTLFVWLPLGFLIFCLLARDALARGDETSPSPLGVRILAACKRREAAALWLPLAAAALAMLAHDNDAVIAELRRIGGQEHIIRQVFSGIGNVIAGQLKMLSAWRSFLSAAALFVLPATLCAGLWAHVLGRRGFGFCAPGWLDVGIAVTAVLLPLLFLLVAFDVTRLMGWSYFAAFVVMVFLLLEAKPRTTVRRGATWPWAVAPALLAVLFWTTPTIYGWFGMTYLVSCKQFCFKEQTLQAQALDAYRRRTLSWPIMEYSAPGALLPGITGGRENNYRVAREGRDSPGSMMRLNFKMDDKSEGIKVRGSGQTDTAIIGAGRHRLSISYRVLDTQDTNAATVFSILNSHLGDGQQLLQTWLPPEKNHFSTTFETPPDLAGNLFRWEILYNGRGVLELQHVSFEKVGP